MNIYSAKQMRAIDAQVTASGLYTEADLILRAGKAAATAIVDFAEKMHCKQKKRFIVLTGTGKNGADGLVIANVLAEKYGTGTVHLCCTAHPDKFCAVSQHIFSIFENTLKKIVSFSLEAEDLIPEGTIIVDAIVGTGILGKMREPAASWIHLVNQKKGVPVFAIDIPSGLDPDTGIACDSTIQATQTLTFVAPKYGLVSGEGICKSGKIQVLDIGIPESLLNGFNAVGNAFSLKDMRNAVIRNAPDTHKWRRGHVLVIGGSEFYPSVPFLSGEATLRTGAGLVTVALPGKTPVYTDVPKALIIRKIGENSTFSISDVPLLSELSQNATSVVIGPGMSQHPPCHDFLAQLLPMLTKPVVLDADALNILARKPNLFNAVPRNSILTPHAGEMHRLLNAFGFDDKEMTALEKAKKLSELTGCVCVMKGPFSIVYDAKDINMPFTFNLSGSPALATAGSGDVLSGIIGAFILVNSYPALAARMGVFLHGLCGELTPDLLGCDTPDQNYSTGVIADDLLKAIPLVLRKCQPY